MRTSVNQLAENGTILNGYDYDLQAWILNGVIQDCNHPQAGDLTVLGEVFDGCNCYGRAHAGETVA